LEWSYWSESPAALPAPLVWAAAILGESFEATERKVEDAVEVNRDRGGGEVVKDSLALETRAECSYERVQICAQ
jgi:hypothetical protein